MQENKTPNYPEAAQIILTQLGGNKFIAMTGAKNLVNVGNGLTMQIMKNAKKVKWVKITYKYDDYKMEFKKQTRTLDPVMTELMGKKQYKRGIETIYEIDGLMFDQLREVFEKQTGLYTRL